MTIRGTDIYGDRYEIRDHGFGEVELTLVDTDYGTSLNEAVHTFTPKKARKLAKRLKKAARRAEAA